MSRLFEEIDTQPSPLGEISLRKRIIPAVGPDPIYEVKLGNEFLMSSVFVDAEIALADLGLQAIEGENLSVVVGGLGLGCTADAALGHTSLGELLVVEALETVITWHQQEKVPLGKNLNQDPRCRYVLASFFDLATQDSSGGFDPDKPGRIFDAVLLDIDHSPSAFLNNANAAFYSTENLSLMAAQIRSGGVFAMWSQDPPDDSFESLLATVFDSVESKVIKFYNPFQSKEATNTIYIAKK
ncbi:MAG: spermidine synthase [Flavobacteriales bacterium]|jgi:spermidine synthase